MTASRIVVANGTYAVTRRTQFRKLFWTPSSPLVHEGYLYALALAQEKYGVAVHHGQILATHTHFTLTPSEANLPEVLRFVHRESSRFLQEYLLAHGYDAPDNVWDKRPTHVMRLVGPGAQLSWLLYEHLNCVAAGLVDRVEDYPGFASDFGLMKNGIVPLKKPPLYYAKHNPTEMGLRVTPAQSLARAVDGDIDALVYRLRKGTREMEDAYREERRRDGGGVLGAARVRRIHPWSEPRTARERRGQRVPTFKIGDVGDERTRRELAARCAAERRGFLVEQRESLERWRDGERDIVFPAGTYQMRVMHGADVGDPHADAILCVGDRDAEEDGIDLDAGELRDVLGCIGEVVRAEADEEVDVLSDVVDGRAPVERAEHEDGDAIDGSAQPRASAQAMPLITPAATTEGSHAARVVTLRTRRERAPP